MSPQLAFQGNLVNPLETVAIGSFSNRLLFGFCLRSCFTMPKPQTKLNRLSILKVFRKCKSKAHPFTKAARPSPLFVHSFASHLPGRHRKCVYSTSGTKATVSFIPLQYASPVSCLNDLRYFPFHSFTLPLEPSLQTRQVCEVARASCLSTCLARINQSSHAHPPKKHRLFATTFYSPLLVKKKILCIGINQIDKKDNSSSGVIKVKPSGFLKKSPPSFLW